MTAELATVGASRGALALRSDQDRWTEAQRAALGQLGLSDAPNGDLAVFMHVSQRTGLDPFSRQIYLIGRNEKQSDGTWKKKYTIQTGIDGFRIIADRHPDYGGQIGPEWCGPDGVWHEFWAGAKPPVAARVGVIRRGWERPVYAVAMFAEYVQMKSNGQVTNMWATKGALMIAKCAEALALRKAFPHDLAGLTALEEAPLDDRPGTDDRPARTAAPVSVADLTGQSAAPSRNVGEEDAELVEVIEELDWDALVAEAQETGSITKAWRLARELRPDDQQLRERIQAAGRTGTKTADDAPPLDPAGPADDKQHRHMHALWNKADLSREERLAVTSHLVGREIATSKELKAAEAATVIGHLQEADSGSSGLYTAVSGWLEEWAAAQAGASS